MNFSSLVVDFNYTDTFRQVISSIEKEKFRRPTHIKIHGSLEQNNIVFGVDDSAKINPNHIFLKKSVSKFFKPSEFDKSIIGCRTLMFFGYSLGETDHMYFQKYFRSACKEGGDLTGKTVGIYNHGESSYLDLHKQLDVLTNRQIGMYKKCNNVDFVDAKKTEKADNNK